MLLVLVQCRSLLRCCFIAPCVLSYVVGSFSSWGNRFFEGLQEVVCRGSLLCRVGDVQGFGVGSLEVAAAG